MRKASRAASGGTSGLSIQLDTALLDAPGNGQAVAQEAFGDPEQGEGVAVKLVIVEKRRPVDAL